MGAEKTVNNRKSFLKLDEAGRIEALVSGVCNNGTKMLALYAMQKGREYINSELNAAAENLLGNALPFKGDNVLHAYCKNSLGPVGVILEKKVVRMEICGRRLATAYEITEEGEIYGKPLIERFLLLANTINMPLNLLNGSKRAVEK